VIDGITFNAVVLDPKDYKRWQWAAEAVKKGPKYVRPAFKSARVELWTWLVSIAPFSFDY
jgi:hypothetical protein